MIKILIANDKGGVGKSLLAQFCVVALRGMNRDPRLVEYDRQPKLCRWFGVEEVKTFSAGPGVISDQDARTFWDPMVDWLNDNRAMVVDFGAQAWGGFLEWADASQLATLHRSRAVRLLVPVTADLEAISAATAALTGAKRVLPEAQVLLLKLDKDGAVDFLTGVGAYDTLLRTAEATGARHLVYPLLRAEALPALDARGWRLDTIVAMQDVAGFGVSVPKPALQRTVVAVRAWMTEMYRILLPEFLGALAAAAPPQPPPPQPAALPPHVVQQWGHMLRDLPSVAGVKPWTDARTLSPATKR